MIRRKIARSTRIPELATPALIAYATSHFLSKPTRNQNEVVVGCGKERTIAFTVAFWFIAEALYLCHDFAGTLAECRTD